MGDIMKLNGAELPPVDIITFGSPCQGLSAAGKRLGFDDPRSGLFSEAIRIIREMREATNGRYPTWAIWENVPGALFSNGGLDFKAVLEAFTEAEIPFPRSKRWTNAGMVRSGGTDLAWCVYNAQYFGTAQRRRRIFLIRDFGGERSGEILFVPKSLQGYFAAGGTPRQGAPAHAVRSVDGAVRNVRCLTPWDRQQSRVFTEDSISPTLAGADGGGGRNPAGLVYTAGFCAGAGAKANGIGYEEETAPTIKGGACGFQMPTVLCAATGQPNAEKLENLSAALTCYHEQPIITHPQISGTLMASGAGLSRPAGMASETDLCVAMAVDCRNLRERPELSGTLQAKENGSYSLNYQNPVRMGYIVRRLMPMECERLQGYPDGWTEKGHDGKHISDTARYMMLGNSVAVPCVVYILQGIAEASLKTASITRR